VRKNPEGGGKFGAVSHEINFKVQIYFRANKGARDRATVVISRREARGGINWRVKPEIPGLLGSENLEISEIGEPLGDYSTLTEDEVIKDYFDAAITLARGE